MKDIIMIIMGILAALYILFALISGVSEIGVKGMLAFFMFFVIGGFINFGLQNLFQVKEDSSGEELCGFAAFFITIALYYFAYQAYKKYQAKKKAGFTSAKDFLFHKDNIHELNFKAQFANFRKQYKQDIEAVGIDKYGKEFGRLIDEVENKVLTLSSNPENVPENINYRITTIDQIMLAILDKVSCGSYIYRGMPAYETKYFCSMYRKILNDEHKAGDITDEEMKTALENLSYEIRNNG